MIELGTRAKDKITGFMGMITARTEYLNGCKRYLVQPEKLKKDGGTADAEWVDEEQLEILSSKKRRSNISVGGPPIKGDAPLH